MALDYYKIYEFEQVFFQRSVSGAIVETEFKWPNKLTPQSELQTFQWEGGGQKKKIVVLTAQNWDLDLDAVPNAQHATIFGKGAITSGVPATMVQNTAVGYGGGSDAGGVTVGMRAVANALRGDTEQVVKLDVWAPICTVTLAQAMGLQAGNIGDKTKYNISATKTTKDITGLTISGASSDGEFFFIAENA